jgi:hypothetical protein
VGSGGGKGARSGAEGGGAAVACVRGWWWRWRYVIHRKRGGCRGAGVHAFVVGGGYYVVVALAVELMGLWQGLWSSR